MNNASFLFLLSILAPTANAFVPAIPRRASLSAASSRTSSSSLFAIPKDKPPEKSATSQKAFEFNVTQAEAEKEALEVIKKESAATSIVGEEEGKEPQEVHRVHKLTVLGDKNLWYDEKTGTFYESCPEERIPLATIFERTVDTLEDAVVHARRIPYEKGWVQDSGNLDDRPTVVVLGSGWASHALIKVADTFRMRLVVVSPTNHFVFTPMLASSAVGTIEYRSMTEAVRASNPLIENYIEGKAVDIDVETQTLTVELSGLLEDTRTGTPEPEIIHYDKLVVAVGCKVLDTFVPGADKHCYKLKSCDDARRLRTAIGECLEFGSRPAVAPDSSLSEQESQKRREIRKKRLTWVIVGAGPTGVELAGELTDFIKDITKDRVGPYHKLKGEIRIILVEGGPCVLPPFEESLREHAYQSLLDEGVDVRLNTFVKEVGDGFIKLQHKDGGPIEEIDFGLSVWAAGIGSVPFVETLLDKLPEEVRARGNRIKVDKWLRCQTKKAENFGSILIMGDAAAFEKKKDTVLPQTAQVAAQQGAYVARILDRNYDLSVTPPVLHDNSTDASVAMMQNWLKLRGLEEAPGFRFLNLGVLAYLGEGKALSQIQLGDKPIFVYAGSVAFMLWRSVYLVKQVATRNRILVLFDWFKCKLFGRDITRL